MAKKPIKPIYFDIAGREVAKIEVHINNGNDVSFMVMGQFAINSTHEANAFLNSLDYEAIGLSSSAMMYRGDEKNGDQYAGEIFKGSGGYYGINLLAIDREKLLASEIPVFGWHRERISA